MDYGKYGKKNRVHEAAAQWGVSVKTAWNYVYSSKVGVLRIGKSVRIPQSEVDRVLEEGFTPARRTA